MRKDTGNHYAERIEQIIRRDLSNDRFNVEKLAKSLGVSLSYLREIACDQFGMSPQKLIEKFRMEKAIELISKGEKLYRVSSMVGYSRSQTFSRAFKKAIGVSPSALQPKRFDTLKSEFYKQTDKLAG